MICRLSRPAALVLSLLALGLAGCGGSKVLKRPRVLTLAEPLAVVSNEHIEAVLDWVIVRDGPGTWARNANWDEYLLRVSNRHDAPLAITGITVVDSLGTPVGPATSRRALVKGSRAAARRYRSQGLKVKAGVGGATLMAAGAGAAIAGYGVGGAAMYGSVSSAAAGAAVGALVLAPVLAVGGVVRAVNESQVSQEIEQRQTPTPMLLEPGPQARLVTFVPVTPSPQRVEVHYLDQGRPRTMTLDTQLALNGLHLVPAKGK